MFLGKFPSCEVHRIRNPILKCCELGLIGVPFDNIQAYVRARDQNIGKESRMVTGLAATAIRMEDYDLKAFDLKAFVERQSR